MANPTPNTNRVFLPYVRRGLAAAITVPDAGDRSAGVPVVSFDAQVTVASPGTPALTPAQVNLPLVGPGDIAGLDPRVVVRTTPLANDSDAEFGHFAAIEFDQADLPWRYTPAAAPSSGQLHPWFTLLVCLNDGKEAVITPATPTQKLAQATVLKSGLPPLSGGWAWAHIQLQGAAETAANGTNASAQLATVFAQQPGQFVTRLLNPRVLLPQTSYIALLVPTFERGRLAGIGTDPAGTDALDWAWHDADAQAILPVYYQWQFQTGVVNDFEGLVAELQPQPVPATVGRRNIDVSVPGFEMPNAAATGTSMAMEGALQSVQAAAMGEPVALSTNWLTQLESFVNTASVSLDGGPQQPLVGPPLYGRWYSGQTQLTSTPNQWVSQLNTDPRNRVAASLGTLVLDERQQALLASAWSQIEGLLQANGELKVLQLGREAFTRIFTRHITSGSIDNILLVLEILHRWVLQGSITIHAETQQSVVGRAIFEPQWRRFSRPRGPIGRRQLRNTGGSGSPLSPVTLLGGGSFQPAPPPPTPTGMSTPPQIFQGSVPGNLTPTEIVILTSQGNDAMLFWGILLFCVSRQILAGGTEGRAWWWLLRVLRFGLELIRLAAGTTSTTIRIAIRDGTLTPAQVSGAPQVSTFTAAISTIPNPIPPPPVPGGTDSPDAAAWRGALAAILTYFQTPEVPPVVPTAIDVNGTSTALVNGLSPAVTLLASISTRLLLDLTRMTWQPVDTLEPVLASPIFPQPMWKPLSDESVDWIVPGLEDVAANSVGLVVSNQAFIEAYMVGLNQEMGRTLLWNGYPTDQRGTYFRQFWDSRATPQTATQDLHDIEPIVLWPQTAALGTNSARTAAPSVVLLVRADLIRRYPNVVVYAFNNSGGSADNESSHVIPLFSGQLTADISFYGFPFGLSDALQGAGYSFVLEEHPSEPTFDPPAGATGFVDPASITGVTTAAGFASATLQPPTRAIIPAALLIPPN